MTVSSIKVKVVRKPTLKLKVLPRFPSEVTVSSPILLNRAGGNYAFSFDQSAISSGTTIDAGQIISGTIAAARISATGKPLVILSTGQSYLVQTPALAWTPAANVLVWNFDGTDGHVGTSYVSPSATTINISNKIASDIAKANPTRTVYLINVAFSGIPISHWLSGASSPDVFLNIQNQITAALAAIGATQIDLFLWMQGQGDCVPLNANYIANHATMMSRFWADTTPGHIWMPKETPCIISSIQSVADSNSLNADADNMNVLLQGVAASDPDKRQFVYLSALTGSTYFDLTAHPTAQGHFAIGAMIANEFLHGSHRPSVNGVVNTPATGQTIFGNVTYSAGAALTYNGNSFGVALPTPAAGAVSHWVGADGLGAFSSIDTFGGFTGFLGRRANGTLAAKTTLVTDNLIVTFGAQGYDGSAYSGGNTAALNFFAQANWSGTSHSTYGTMALVPNGSTTAATYHRWDVGSYTINGATSGSLKLAVPAAAGSNTLTFPAGTTDFSATGGASRVVKQTTAGGALTVAQVDVSDLTDGAWTAYTPTVTASVGTFTTVSATGRYKRLGAAGKTIFVQIDISITTVGTASGLIRATIPFTAAAFNYAGIAKERLITGKSGVAEVSSGGTFAFGADSSGVTFIAAGAEVIMGITYEVP